LQYPLDGVSAKLKFIKTNKQYQEKHLELKALVDQYGKNFIVAPSLPMAHYLLIRKANSHAIGLLKQK
jgi:hypothetical protein